MASGAIRKSYDGIVACLPVTIPYRHYSTNSAHWWLGRALREIVTRARLRPKDIDGFAVSSFTVGPDTAVGLTQHFGLSPRWLITFRSEERAASSRCAARHVRCRLATPISLPALLETPTTSICFRKMLSTFSRFAQDAVYPYGSGGAQRVVRADHSRLHEQLWRQARGLRQALYCAARQRAVDSRTR